MPSKHTLKYVGEGDAEGWKMIKMCQNVYDMSMINNVDDFIHMSGGASGELLTSMVKCVSNELGNV